MLILLLLDRQWWRRLSSRQQRQQRLERRLTAYDLFLATVRHCDRPCDC